MDIAGIRDRIDEVDKELLACFLERMRLSEEVAACKREQRMPMVNREREREVLKRAQEHSGDLEPYAYELFHTLIGLSRARQFELYPRTTAIRSQI